MRIAIVGQPFDRVQLPVEGGSIKIWSHEVARRLAGRRQVVVYARRGGNQAPVEWADGVEYRRASAVSEPALLGRLRLPWHRSRPPFSRAYAYCSYFARVAMDLRRFQPDCILLHNYSQGLPILRAFNPGARIALLMHCRWLEQLDRQMLEPRLRQADLVCGCSEFLSEGIRRRFPQLAARVRTIYNGVDLERFSPAEGRGWNRVLFVGRVSPEKGVHVLLEAFERVLRRRPEAELSIVGPGAVLTPELLGDQGDDPLVSALAPLCRPGYPESIKANLPARVAPAVHFVGNVGYSRLAEYYRRADLFVFPSILHEAFGLPVAEAMAAGLPVIATESGGIPEVVQHGYTGLLAPRGNAGALAEAITLLLQEPKRARRMGQAGRERAGRFTWDRTAEQLVEVMEGPLAAAAVAGVMEV
jgi:glycosyltransferase involved in cell wall biosynthesis